MQNQVEDHNVMQKYINDSYSAFDLQLVVDLLVVNSPVPHTGLNYILVTHNHGDVRNIRQCHLQRTVHVVKRWINFSHMDKNYMNTLLWCNKRT